MNATEFVQVLAELYGQEKVFISQAEWMVASEMGLTSTEFKALVVAAWRAHLLVLTRCDMPEAFDPENKYCAKSEIQWHGATFHFLTAKSW